jgi:hypothetical protein
MDHDDIREQLELAAVEPGGLDRLMAGDTPTARAVAAHLAGCDSCADELRRLERSVPLLRDLVRTTPPTNLRERTLAFVRANGIARGRDASMVRPFPVADAPAAAAGSGVATSRVGRGSRTLLPWVAAIAAAVVLSVGVTTILIVNRVDSQIAALDQQVEGLEKVTLATIGITAEPDVQRVTLASTTGSDTDGTIVFSPGTEQLVVVATGLTEPPADQEYRCWVEVDGARQSIGKMFFSDELAYWVGQSPAISDVPSGSTFGVSLTEVGGATPSASPVISGQL